VNLKRFTALAMSIAMTGASFPVVAVAAQVAAPGPSQQATQSTGSGVSGTVVRSDRKTPVANACLRLRNVDTNAILARSVSDRTGAFSFAASGPGMYIVEAIDCANTGVLAVSDALSLTGLPRTTVVVLPSTATSTSFVSSTAFLVLSAASAAAITVFAVQAGSSSPAVSSPEQ
jgi:hypothetical protein